VLSTADPEGNMVSWVNSNFAGFGSGITEDLPCDRLDPLALVVGKIGERHGAAERLRFGDDRARNLALVEGVAAARCQQPESLGEVGIAAAYGRCRRSSPNRDRVRCSTS
jgi:hypothetical protein